MNSLLRFQGNFLIRFLLSSNSYWNLIWLEWIRQSAIDWCSLPLILEMCAILRSSSNSFFSFSWLICRLQKIAPTCEMLQERMRHPNTITRVTTTASVLLLTTMSPKPQVEMIVTAQQMLQKYWVSQGQSSMLYLSIQLSSGEKLAMARKMVPMRWARNRLARISLTSARYWRLALPIIKLWHIISSIRSTKLSLSRLTMYVRIAGNTSRLCRTSKIIPTKQVPSKMNSKDRMQYSVIFSKATSRYPQTVFCTTISQTILMTTTAMQSDFEVLTQV